MAVEATVAHQAATVYSDVQPMSRKFVTSPLRSFQQLFEYDCGHYGTMVRRIRGDDYVGPLWTLAYHLAFFDRSFSTAHKHEIDSVVPILRVVL